MQPAARSWQLISLAVLLGIAVSTSLRANWGSDNAFVVKAAETLLAGGSPYEDKRFLYLPSAVIMAVPEALLPREVLRWLLPVGMSGLLGAGWLAALRIFAVPLRSRFAVGGFAVFALVYKPYINLVLIGNWTAISAAALPVALLPRSGARGGRPGWWWGSRSRASRCSCPSGCSSWSPGGGGGWPRPCWCRWGSRWPVRW